MTPEGNGPIRVVVDTSVLLPILTYRFPSTNWLVKLWQSNKIKPLAREETLDELDGKLLEMSPTAKEYPARKFVERASRQYTPWCEMILADNAAENPQCQDETDQKFIDLAFAGRANVLVTRDDKLLIMDPDTPFLITRDDAFRKSISAEPASTEPQTTAEE